LGKEGSKNVPCVIVVGFERVFLQTAPKMSSKRTKMVVKQNLLAQALQMCFTFSRFFTDFALLGAAPLAP
jgi:hypothetical protein